MLKNIQATATSSDRLSIVYDVQGDGDPLLLIAGMSAERGLWGYVREGLNARYRTIAFDNRDAGTSERATTSYSAEDMARDALAVLDAAGTERVILWAGSSHRNWHSSRLTEFLA